jgi:hypothetical protein
MLPQLLKRYSWTQTRMPMKDTGALQLACAFPIAVPPLSAMGTMVNVPVAVHEYC